MEALHVRARIKDQCTEESLPANQNDAQSAIKKPQINAEADNPAPQAQQQENAENEDFRDERYLMFIQGARNGGIVRRNNGLLFTNLQ